MTDRKPETTNEPAIVPVAFGDVTLVHDAVAQTLTANTVFTKPHSNAQDNGTLELQIWEKVTGTAPDILAASSSQNNGTGNRVDMTCVHSLPPMTSGTFYAMLRVEWMVPLTPEERKSTDVTVP